MTSATGQRVWRVLVVDDEENLNWSLVTSLRKDQYAADGALTGEHALRLMASQPYDIVVSDVKMPGMDGFELLHWLHQNRPQIRVVMMTAFGSPTDRADALHSGAIAYLEKPFDLHALKEELRRLTSATPSTRTSGPSQSDGYDLLEVARVINLARRDIALLVATNGLQGRLRFLRGDLIWAEAGQLQGDDAFVALSTSPSGRVQPESWDGRSPRNVTQPLSHLIYLALARRERPTSIEPGPDRGPSATAHAATAAATAHTSAPPASAMPSSTTAPRLASVPVSTGNSVAPPASSVILSAPPASTAALSPMTPAQMDAARATVEALCDALPDSSGVVLLRPDGAVVAQRWKGVGEVVGGVYAHLAACAQAALRALLLGGWGDLEDVQVTSLDRNILLRRLGRTDRAAVLVMLVPRDDDLAASRTALREREPALLEALR
jgi:CheY-like chemotaxis protein/predicted regulator of Ras-like GTPase activity (Roadblock/LC7/MglB family)